MIHKITTRFVSKWLILLLDLCIVTAAFNLAVLARFNFDFTYVNPEVYKYHLILVLVSRFVSFFVFESYSGIVRHTSVEDARNIIKTLTTSSLLLIAITLIGHQMDINQLKIPYSILLIDFFVSVFVMIVSRFIVKSIYDRLISNQKEFRPVLVYGAGHLGRITKNSLYNDKRYKYKILYFLDDNPQLNGKSIEGITILNKKNELGEFLKRQKRLFPGLEVIFAIQSISSVLRNEIIDSLLKTGVPLKILPPIKQWMNGELKASQIHEIKIEDLLEREAISLNNRLVNEYLNGKKIMVTGAAGSIGSELVRQILRFEPEELILVDQAESALYDLETEIRRLSSKNQLMKASFHIRDVSSEHRMEELFQIYTPQVVFHAAAYKHVPLMEEDPFNAVKVNVKGTMNMANLALKYQSNRFVFISTDKAVNPTNVMGASKRLAEKYVQCLNAHQNTTRFVTTRFGNVLGSNGSVIPLFKKQIEKGGPVTVTHPDIIRYFMTIPEACQLVLEAGTMGRGGEIYVFEMGEPVRIVDLAHRMIRLSGFEPEEDIQIEFTGLRPGEKLYEELLGDSEKTKATHHPKILIAQVKPESHEELQGALERLLRNLESQGKENIVKEMKALVPEYVSENSVYSSLDESKS